MDKLKLNPFVLLTRINIKKTQPATEINTAEQPKIAKPKAKNKFKCYFCGHNCRDLHNLNQHLYTHTNEECFSCSVCKFPFRNHNQLAQHIRVIHNKQKFECQLCNRKFIRNRELSDHLATHDEPSKQCPQCPKKFYMAKALNFHVGNYHSGKTFKCGICKKTFSSTGNLRGHVKAIHEKIVRFECSFCQKGVYSRGDLNKHMKVHLCEKDLTKCPELGCSLIFKSPYAARIHRQKYHPRQEEENERKCKLCNKIYGSAKYLKQHLAIIHAKEGKFPCILCGKVYIRKRLFDEHITSAHTAERSFICNRIGCGKAFAIPMYLRNHLNDHEDREQGRKYPCDKCPNVVFETKRLFNGHNSKFHRSF